MESTSTPKLTDVILYGHVRVHPLIRDLWLKQVTIQKYSVPLTKLSNAQIENWQSKPGCAWENIDPYSSLEDVGSSSTTKNTPKPSPEVVPSLLLNHNVSIKDRLRR